MFPVMVLLVVVSLIKLRQEIPLTTESMIERVIAPVLDKKGIVIPDVDVVVTLLKETNVLVVLATLMAEVNAIALTRVTVFKCSPSNEISIPSGIVI